MKNLTLKPGRAAAVLASLALIGAIVTAPAATAPEVSTGPRGSSAAAALKYLVPPAVASEDSYIRNQLRPVRSPRISVEDNGSTIAIVSDSAVPSSSSSTGTVPIGFI